MDIKSLRNSQFIYNYESALHFLRNNIPKSKENSHTDNSVILLVGDPHHKLHDEIKGEKIISLEEMCALYPDKVPLSYRNKNN